jgi:hypothetical protein
LIVPTTDASKPKEQKMLVLILFLFSKWFNHVFQGDCCHYRAWENESHRLFDGKQRWKKTDALCAPTQETTSAKTCWGLFYTFRHFPLVKHFTIFLSSNILFPSLLLIWN